MLEQYSVRATAIPKEVRATRSNRKWNFWMIYCKVSLSDYGYWEPMVLAHREAVGKEVG